MSIIDPLDFERYLSFITINLDLVIKCLLSENDQMFLNGFWEKKIRQ